MTEYILKATALARYKQRGITNCPRCGKKLKLGQRVVSRYVSRSGYSVLYHKECYEEMFHK